ncbi:MAG: hypothetical protein ACT4PZ_01545 [Panacagrimonas sp.]
MDHYQGKWRFIEPQVGQDGVEYNLASEGYADALPAWRYLDLTRHVEFMAAAVLHTIRFKMSQEALHLQQHDAARSRLEDVLEGPDADLDRIIRSVLEQKGKISGALKRQFPKLDDAQLAEMVSRAVLGETDSEPKRIG